MTVACEDNPHAYDPDHQRRQARGDTTVVEETCSICGTVRVTALDAFTGALISRQYRYPSEPAPADDAEVHPEVDCRTCGVTVLVVDVTNWPATDVCFGPRGPRTCNSRAMTNLAKRGNG